MSVTVVRNISWLVAWQQVSGEALFGGRHVYMRDADLAFENGVVIYAGRSFQGEAAVEIDGRDRMVMPGLVNIHSHPASEPLRKGITDETLSPGFHHSSLYEYLTVFDNDVEGRRPALDVALAELLQSGCTTITDISAPHDGWLDSLAASGIRAVAAPSFRDARWFTRDGHSLQYEWDLAGGRSAFDRALQVIDEAAAHPCGRLSGMVFPGQVDTCSAELLRDAFDAARDRGLPWQTHASQSVVEFHEMYRRHGKTPVRFLDDLGVLGESSIVGHAIFLDHHPWLHWTSRNDLKLLADSGTSVAHCPTVFARRGISLRSFGGYLRQGVNLGIGTDTYPHHFLEEIRSVGYYAKVAEGTVADHRSEDVFNAATVGGARALGRDDLGRLSVGAKADFVVVDVTHPSMQPMREPLRSLIYVAAERPITGVWVDGRNVVDNGRVTTIDVRRRSAELQAAQERSLARTRQLDWAGRSSDELSPMLLSTAVIGE